MNQLHSEITELALTTEPDAVSVRANESDTTFSDIDSDGDSSSGSERDLPVSTELSSPIRTARCDTQASSLSGELARDNVSRRSISVLSQADDSSSADEFGTVDAMQISYPQGHHGQSTNTRSMAQQHVSQFSFQSSIVLLDKNIFYWKDGPMFGPIFDSRSIFQYRYALFFDAHQAVLTDAHLPSKTDASLLEVGCNSGDWARTMAQLHSYSILAIDSAGIAPERISGIPNYRSEKIDFANNFLPFQTLNWPKFDFLRLTRQRGEGKCWPEICHKLFRHARPGASIEIYDVLDNAAAVGQAEQPLWNMVPTWVVERAQAYAIEMPNHIRIMQCLLNSGFVDIQHQERSYTLVWSDERRRSHINGLIREALLSARAHNGLSGEGMQDLRNGLCYEAQKFGLVFRSFTITARRPT